VLLGAGVADVETVLVGGGILKEGSRLVGPVAGAARELLAASRTRLRGR
jgi:5-methylthioadenosine/S-adenosylhomocysteine deaminase